MKKIVSIVLMFCMFIGLAGCSSKEPTKEETKKDPKEIIESANFKDNGWLAGIMWGCTFSDMDLTVMFNEKEPEQYYANNSFIATQMKSIELYPDKTKKSEWLYIIFKDGKFVVDEEDIKEYQDKGRTEALENYNKKMKDLGITTEDLGAWFAEYFNGTVRGQLVGKAGEAGKDLVEKIKSAGYSYVKDDKGRKIISSKKDSYKIIINTGNCMVVNADMDIDSETKSGYLYAANQGTVGGIKKGKSTFVYRYSDNAILEGKPSLEEYADVKELKKWYDAFLTKLKTSTDILVNVN